MDRRPAAPDLSPEVADLIRERPVFDAHADAIARAVDLGDDLGVRSDRGHLDLVRGAEGGLGAWVVVAWVDPDRFLERSFERANAMIDAAHALAERHPDRFRIVRDGAELAAARAGGQTAGILGIEGGHAIEEDLDKLRAFHARGLRVMTLVWNNHLPWIRSCQDGAGPEVPEGLSPFGREVVGAMNELGIVVDLSHAGERSFDDALETTTHPVIASHSGCKALHDHPRNLTDTQLRALAGNGGVVGIVFHPGFLDAEARAEEVRVRRTPAYTELDREDPGRLFVEQQRVMRATARPMPAARLIDHVVHAVEIAGIDHVGIGSDYDGFERGPEWMEDATGYGVLAELLVRRGFGVGDVRKVLAGNMERVFGEVTAGAALARS
jgi:membrane dipeptidase